MKFSKDKFNKNASKTIKKLLSGHIDVIDRMEVKFDGELGEIENYVVEGEEFLLYPVYKNWCEYNAPIQISLF